MSDTKRMADEANRMGQVSLRQQADHSLRPTNASKPSLPK